MAAVLVIAVRVRSLDGGLAIDRWFSDALVPHAPNGVFTDRRGLRRIASIGSPPVLAAYIAGVGGFALGRGRGRIAAVAGAAPLIAVLIAEVILKPVVGRVTAGGAWSFPSGTTTAVAAMCTSAFLLSYRARRSWASIAFALGGVVVVGVDLAVIALSWHHASDVAAGSALGLGVVSLAAAADAGRGRQDPED